MEIVDVYNKRKELTGKKKERYEKVDGQYTQYVHVWIMNDKNEFLIQKRAESKKINPNKWSQTGGAVDSGETVIEAAIREVKEELGISIGKEDIEFMLSYKRKYTFMDVFLVKKNIELKDIKVQKEEVKEVKWVTKEEIEDMVKSGKIVGTLKLYYKLFFDLLKDYDK